jgi:hypothetical protein
MTVHVSDANSARRLSLSQKLAVASGAAAAFAGVAAPQSAEAGIVESTTLPMSPGSWLRRVYHTAASPNSVLGSMLARS